MTSLNKCTSYKQTREKQAENSPWSSPAAETGWLWPDHQPEPYTSDVSARTPFDGAPANGTQP